MIMMSIMMFVEIVKPNHHNTAVTSAATAFVMMTNAP